MASFIFEDTVEKIGELWQNSHQLENPEQYYDQFSIKTLKEYLTFGSDTIYSCASMLPIQTFEKIGPDLEFLIANINFLRNKFHELTILIIFFKEMPNSDFIDLLYTYVERDMLNDVEKNDNAPYYQEKRRRVAGQIEREKQNLENRKIADLQLFRIYLETRNNDDESNLYIFTWNNGQSYSDYETKSVITHNYLRAVDILKSDRSNSADYLNNLMSIRKFTPHILI